MSKGLDTILHKECFKKKKLFNLELEETWELSTLVCFHIQVRDTNSKWLKGKAVVLVQELTLWHENLVFLSLSLGSALLYAGLLFSRDFLLTWSSTTLLSHTSNNLVKKENPVSHYFQQKLLDPKWLDFEVISSLQPWRRHDWKEGGSLKKAFRLFLQRGKANAR